MRMQLTIFNILKHFLQSDEVLDKTMFSSSDEFKCGLCQLAYKNFFNFLEHKIQHCDSESWIQCSFCCDVKQFYNKSTLCNHLYEKHLMKLNQPFETDRAGMKSCDAVTKVVPPVNKEAPDLTSAQMDVGNPDKLFIERNPLPKVATCSYLSNNDMYIFKNSNEPVQSSSDSQLTSHLPRISDNKTSLNHFNDTNNDSVTDIKNVSPELSQKVDNHSYKPEANHLSDNVSVDSIYESSNTGNLALGNSAEEKLTQTTATFIHPVRSSFGSFVTGDTSSPSPAEKLIQSSFTLSDKLVFQENGNGTGILLPLPLDLSSTHSLCQALNLSLRSASDQLGDVSKPSHAQGLVITNSKSISQSSLEENCQNERKVKEDADINTLSTLADKICDQTLQDTSPTVSSKPFDSSMAQNLVVNSSASEEDTESLSHDFYFLLGNMDIKGSSLTYQRTEFRCLHCSFSTAWRPSLVKHMKQAHKDNIEIHSILDIRNLDPLKNTSATEGDKKWKVIKMSQYLLGNQKLKPQKHRVRKMERQDVPGKYHCPLCHKVFGRLRYMRRHQSTHRTERTHLCDNCGKSFKTKAILVAHRRSHKSRSYHCPQCPFTSSSSPAIHIHRQLHPNGSVICEVCGNAYIDKSTLNKHMKVHDVSRPFPCTHPGCTWRFKTEVMKKAHVRSHTTVGKFPCSYCGYIFRQKHHLQRHIAKLHHEQQAKNTATTSQELMSSHVLTLTQSIPASSFITQNLSVGQNLLLESAGHHDIMKNPVGIQGPLTPPCGLIAHSEMFSPSANIICPISDASFSSGYADSEHAMIEVLVEDKHGRGSELGLEEEKVMKQGITSNSLTNLEYITETGEIVHLLSAGQTYVARDQYGNLVHYKLSESHGDSEQIYLINVNNTTVMADTSELPTTDG
ncbi:zinc finger protein Xfin [Biomphalaria glabrata]|nr:zinc finger protein Xfin [Biomphalaria glabrata]